MPQLQLPMFPEGVTHITNQLAVMKKDSQVTYFNGHMPVFNHDETDIQTFRMITSPRERTERILRSACEARRGGVGGGCGE